MLYIFVTLLLQSKIHGRLKKDDHLEDRKQLEYDNRFIASNSAYASLPSGFLRQTENQMACGCKDPS